MSLGKSRDSLELLANMCRVRSRSPAERAAYEALNNLSATWKRRNAKLKQSVTQTIQGVTLEQLRTQHADRRTG